MALIHCSYQKGSGLWRRMSKDKVLLGNCVSFAFPGPGPLHSEGTENLKSEVVRLMMPLASHTLRILKEVTVSIPQSQAAFSAKNRMKSFSNSSDLVTTHVVVHEDL